MLSHSQCRLQAQSKGESMVWAERDPKFPTDVSWRRLCLGPATSSVPVATRDLCRTLFLAIAIFSSIAGD